MASMKRNSFDYWLLSVVLILSCLGLMMIFSASALMAAQKFEGDKFHYLTRQIEYLLLSLVVMWGCTVIPAKFWTRGRYLFLLLAIGLLGLTVFSPLGITAGHARRWIRLGPVSFQSLEFVKLSLVFYLAYFYANKQEIIHNFDIGILPPLLITLLLGGLLILQPDLGGAVFLLVLFVSMAFAGGVPILKLSVLGVAGIVVLIGFIFSASYRIKRIEAFLDPFADPMGKGYQLVQSLYGLANGGIWGLGLGESKQKFFYLPEAHNDFILSILGEELGLIGISVVFVLVFILFWRWVKIVLAQTDLEKKLLAFGVGLILFLGMFLNMGVVFGLLPPKGIAMPFLSYGGSCLLSSFICVGILLRLSKEENLGR